MISYFKYFAVQLLSRVQLCDPMDFSTPGFRVLHYLPEIVQTHVHWVSGAIQPSRPLSIPFASCLQSFPASGSFQMSHLFASGGLSNGASAVVPPMNIRDWFPFRLTGLISLLSKGLWRVFSNTTVQKHQFLVLSLLYGPTLTSIHSYWENHSFD